MANMLVLPNAAKRTTGGQQQGKAPAKPASTLRLRQTECRIPNFRGALVGSVRRALHCSAPNSAAGFQLVRMGTAPRPRTSIVVEDGLTGSWEEGGRANAPNRGHHRYCRFTGNGAKVGGGGGDFRVQVMKSCCRHMRRGFETRRSLS